jgi:hypothetical protein
MVANSLHLTDSFGSTNKRKADWSREVTQITQICTRPQTWLCAHSAARNEASLLSRAFSGFLQGCWRTGRCASAQGS